MTPVAALDAVDAETKSPVVITRSSLSDGGTPEEVVLVGFEAGGLGCAAGRRGASPASRVRWRSTTRSTSVSATRSRSPVNRSRSSGDREHDGARRHPVRLHGAAGGAGAGLHVDRRDQLGARRRASSAPLPAGLASLSSDEVVDQTLQPLEGAIASIDLVRALLWIVAAIIVGAVVYLSALDRQRDFAVLKAVGTPNSSLLGQPGAAGRTDRAAAPSRWRRSSRSSSLRSSRCRSPYRRARSGSSRCWRW